MSVPVMSRLVSLQEKREKKNAMFGAKKMRKQSGICA